MVVGCESSADVLALVAWSVRGPHNALFVLYIDSINTQSIFYTPSFTKNSKAMHRGILCGMRFNRTVDVVILLTGISR